MYIYIYIYLDKNIYLEYNPTTLLRVDCIAFIECMIAGKTLLDYTNLLSPNDYQANDKITYKYFKDKYRIILKEYCPIMS